MLATSIYVVVFRVLHVLLAIAWAGTVFLLVSSSRNPIQDADE